MGFHLEAPANKSEGFLKFCNSPVTRTTPKDPGSQKGLFYNWTKTCNMGHHLNCLNCRILKNLKIMNMYCKTIPMILCPMFWFNSRHDLLGGCWDPSEGSRGDRRGRRLKNLIPHVAGFCLVLEMIRFDRRGGVESRSDLSDLKSSKVDFKVDFLTKVE